MKSLEERKAEREKFRKEPWKPHDLPGTEGEGNFSEDDNEDDGDENKPVKSKKTASKKEAVTAASGNGGGAELTGNAGNGAPVPTGWTPN